MANVYISYFASLGDVTRGLTAGIVGINRTDVIEISEGAVTNTAWPAGCGYAQMTAESACFVAIGAAPNAKDDEQKLAVGSEPIIIGRPRIDGEIFVSACARPIVIGDE